MEFPAGGHGREEENAVKTPKAMNWQTNALAH